MFGFFKRKGAVDPRITLNSVRFDERGYRLSGERPGEMLAWETPEGDGLGTYFFAMKPDLPDSAAAASELAEFYRRKLGDTGAKLAELRIVQAGGKAAVRTVICVPQAPSGRTCVGALTLPFKTFSFVFKCQCGEGEPTGLKEAVLLDRRLAEKGGAGCELNFDDPAHDAEFPDHPVARARRTLDHIARTLLLAPELHSQPEFALPAK
ncbi:MAG TPA: hypothetical protein VNC50_17895 [Planctomycetia bacterium]|jgi:hypothetical protein|nr:hypothetical protein [Planctomycetia bacterium]